MYDSSDDPLVKYYDFTLATCNDIEIAFFKEYVEGTKESVIDLCSGTGILAIEFSRLGKHVFAVEQSKSMIEMFRKKKTEGIEIIESSMENFTIKELCSVCVCRDAFFHNTTPLAQRNTLKSVNRALISKGRFVFNIHYPNHRYLSWLETKEAGEFNLRGEYINPATKEQVKVFQSVQPNFLEQTVTTKLRYETSYEDKIIKEEYTGWISRYTYPYELFYLLELEGFKVKNIYGNYKKEKIGLNTMIIVEAEKTNT